MKVKDLIRQLEQYDQNMEVCMAEYIGCETPIFTIKKIKLIKKGDSYYDGGDLFDYDCQNDPIAKEDMLLLENEEEE